MIKHYKYLNTTKEINVYYDLETYFLKHISSMIIFRRLFQFASVISIKDSKHFNTKKNKLRSQRKQIRLLNREISFYKQLRYRLGQLAPAFRHGYLKLLRLEIENILVYDFNYQEQLTQKIIQKLNQNIQNYTQDYVYCQSKNLNQLQSKRNKISLCQNSTSKEQKKEELLLLNQKIEKNTKKKKNFFDREKYQFIRKFKSMGSTYIGGLFYPNCSQFKSQYQQFKSLFLIL
ncbi:unnamed protein product (macronuclear) [Paramecium tetraurelia]|uniref:Transmembrane protein n=1 Tax=Paramecium tetraurelia TaxID=5888 RepID=A0BYX1_PARTE|nr:uncharacterized protein GSPATT00033591001 [Paramecium tetraurelia]CAK63738.1 unnamed protein product [Paramecium tetraurelia]|eukprot:XP_001431136.1 hypothetical protein (macronuclear) [Paramecium tetraurelia strain d4-2]